MLVVPPASGTAASRPTKLAWPLADFAEFGVALPGGAGDALRDGHRRRPVGTLLPVLLNANQMTVFVDGTGAKQSLNVRALVPLEPSPCPDRPKGAVGHHATWCCISTKL